MVLYVIRHGDPDYENDTITPYGKQQADALAKRMELYGLDKIYTSPMGRAKDTAQPTCDLLGLEYNVEMWTEELKSFMMDDPVRGHMMAINYGGAIFRDDTHREMGKSWHKSPYLSKVPAKKHYDYIVKSSDEFLHRHGYERRNGVYKIIKDNPESIAVFCHSGFGCTWLAHLMDIPLFSMWSGFYLQTSSVTKLTFDGKMGEFTTPMCHYFSDISHVYAEGLEKINRKIVSC